MADLLAQAMTMGGAGLGAGQAAHRRYQRWPAAGCSSRVRAADRAAAGV